MVCLLQAHNRLTLALALTLTLTLTLGCRLTPATSGGKADWLSTLKRVVGGSVQVRDRFILCA